MIIMVLCISRLVVKWLGFGIEQVKLNEPALPKKHDKYSQSSNEHLWLSKGPPGSFQPPLLGPWQAGHKSQELAVSIPGNVLGNIAETCVLCHVKKSGSTQSSWELFLSAVWGHVNKFLFPGIFPMFPGTCSKIPRNGSWEFFLMCPRWRYSSRSVDGTC